LLVFLLEEAMQLGTLCTVRITGPQKIGKHSNQQSRRLVLFGKLGQFTTDKRRAHYQVVHNLLCQETFEGFPWMRRTRTPHRPAKRNDLLVPHDINLRVVTKIQYFWGNRPARRLSFDQLEG
jgi:hypothetical protein